MSGSQLLHPLTDAETPVVERLWQLYSHDMSEIRGTLPNAEGLYKPGRLAGYLDDRREERRPLPDKPHIPDDHFILFALPT